MPLRSVQAEAAVPVFLNFLKSPLPLLLASAGSEFLRKGTDLFEAQDNGDLLFAAGCKQALG